MQNVEAFDNCTACGNARNVDGEEASLPLPRVEARREGLPPLREDAEARNPNHASQSWRCERCTFENGAADNLCEVCLTPRTSGMDPSSSNLAVLMGLLSQGGDELPSNVRRVRPKPPLRILLGTMGGALAGGFFGMWFGGDSFWIVGAMLGIGIALFALGVHSAHVQRRTTLQMISDRRQISMSPLLPLDQVGAQAPYNYNERRLLRPASLAQLSQRQRQIEAFMSQIREAQEPVPTPSYLYMSGALPTHIVTAEELQNVPDELKVCTICIEDFCAGDEQRTLPCFHRFHSACVDRWLHQHSTCPICKHQVDVAGSSAQ
jgi:hypothetical protein